MNINAFDRFLADISSGYWWVSVVFIGLLINIASAYIKEPIDKLLARRSESTAKRRQFATFVFVEEVSLMEKSPAYLTLMGFSEMRHRLMGLSLWAISFLFARGFGNPSEKLRSLGDWYSWVHLTFLLIAMLLMALGLWANNIASSERRMMSAAKQGLRRREALLESATFRGTTSD